LISAEISSASDKINIIAEHIGHCFHSYHGMKEGPRR
jgi:hypothetical protein